MEYKNIINISSVLRDMLEDGAEERKLTARRGEDAGIKKAIEKLESDAAKFDAKF